MMHSRHILFRTTLLGLLLVSMGPLVRAQNHLEASAGSAVPTIALGDTVSGAISVPGETLEYTFTATPGQRVYAFRTTASVAGQLNWTLRDSFGRALDGDFATMTDLGPVMLLGGDYTIFVLAEGDNTPSFTFELIDANPQSFPVTPNGSSVTGTVARTARHDYSFNVAPGTSVYLDRLAVAANSQLGWILTDAVGREVLPLTGNLNDVGPIVLGGGDYTLSVVSRTNGTSSYEFQLTTPGVDSQAISLGAVVNGSIDGAGDIDSYTFTAAAGQAVVLDRITVPNASLFNWRLTDPVGRVLLSTLNLNDTAPIPLVGGDYRLEVLGEGGATGSYSFRVVGGVQRGSTISVGDTVTGDIMTPGKVDEYPFTAAPGQRIFLDRTATSNAGGLNWFLVDSAGREIFSRTVSLADQGPFRLVGGDYTLTVLGEAGITGTYEFLLSDASITNATTALGATETGAITNPGQEIDYSLTVGPGQQITLDVIATSNSSGLNFRLVDSQGQELLRTTNLTDQGPIALVGGTYVLSVLGEVAATGDFEFSVVNAGLSSFVPAGSPLTPGTSESGDISVMGEVDAFTFAATAGQQYFFDLLQGDSSLRWTLLDPAGEPLFENVTASNTTTTNRGPFSLASGTYTLQLTSSTGTPAYEFVVYEFSDFTGTVSLDTPFSGSLTPGQSHRLAFTLGSATEVFFDLQTAASSLRWTLRDAVGEAVFLDVTANSAIGANRGPLNLLAGSYELSFRSTNDGAPNYGAELVTSGSTASSIAIGSTITDGFSVPGDRRSYTFTATQGERIYLDLLMGGSGLRWSLYDPAGGAIFELLTATVSTQDRGPFTLQAGTYELVLDPSGVNLPAFSFALLDVPETTDTLSLDQVESGTFATSAELVRYSLTVPGPSTRVYFDNRLSADNVFWKLIDPDGTTVFDAELLNVVSDQGPVNLAGGTYQLEVGPRGAPSLGFEFEVVTVSDSTTPLTIGVEELATIPSPGSTASFTFDARGDRLVLDLLADIPAAESGRWSLEDSVGEAAGLLDEELAQSAANDDQGPYLLAPGTYRLRLEGRSGTTPTFQFVVRPGERPDPMVVESEWTITRRLDFPRIRSARLHPVDGRIYVGLREGGGIFSIGTDGVPIREDVSQSVAGLGITDSGDVFWSEDGIGRIRLLGTGTWVDGFGAGDADPAGLTFVPATYSGSLLAPGQGVVTDRGDGSVDGVWLFSASASQGESVLIDDASPLVDAVDVAVSDTDLYVADAGPEGAPGFLWRVDSGPTLVDVGATGIEPVGITIDPLDGNILAVDRLGARVVRIDPSNGAVSDVVTGLILPETQDAWASIEVSGDGLRLLVTTEDSIYELRRCDAVSSGLPDCNGNGVADVCDLALTTSQDCNQNGLPDECDILAGTSQDLNADGQPDECLPCSLIDLVFLIDTSLSMNDDAVAVCQLLPDVVSFLSAGGVQVRTEILGIASTPGGDFSCLTANARDLLGGGIGVGCGDFITEITEDWGRGTTAVSELYPWTPGSVRAVVVITDEAPYCGGSTAGGEDSLALAEAINAAQAQGVVVSTITGQGSTADVIDLAAQLAAGTGGSAFSIMNTVNEIGQAIQDLVLASCPCGVGFSDLSPANGSAFPAGTPVTVSGRAISIDPGRPVVAVLVNGEPADSVDLIGNFFDVVTVEAGGNEIEIEVVQACGSTFTSLTLNGRNPGDAGFLAFSDVSLSFDANYADTTFNQTASTLITEVEGCNVSALPVRGPVLFVIDGFTQPSISVPAPDGYTPEGRPYFRLLEEGDVLAPGACTAFRPLYFSNPEQVPVLFDVTWLAPGNAAPVFDTAPPLVVVVGAQYSYAASAFDPDGDAITYSLASAPSGMVIDGSGLVGWTPGGSDLGTHEVRVVATDVYGAFTTQVFSLQVGSAVANRSPSFTSAPPTGSAVGAVYDYLATAFDPDGDALIFSKEAGPAALTVSPAGQVDWAFTLPGVYPVEIKVTDMTGGEARQLYQLTVGSPPSNPGAPQLFGSPAPTGTVGQLYLYQPVASDPDPGDVLAFTLAMGPSGADVDSSTGRLLWTPAPGQEGSHDVALSVSDGAGGGAVQSWSIFVAAPGLNQPPVLESVPPLVAAVGEPYEYTLLAIDPDFESVTYSQVSAPVGFSVDSATGVVTWTPAVAGVEVIALRATDGQGASGNQVFPVTVVDGNQDPVIDSTPPLVASVGDSYRYGVTATDADGDALGFSLGQAPAGMLIDSLTGQITWVPTVAQLGSQAVTVRVIDGRLGEDLQSFTVDVIQDVTPPEVTIDASDSVPFGQAVLVAVGASDDIFVASRTLAIDGAPVLLDANHRAVFDPPVPGNYLLEATATDASGNTGIASAMLTVIPPDPELPVVSLISPAPDARIAVPTDVVVDISDNNPAGLTWVVDFRPDASNEYQFLAKGSGSVTASTVANFDPTLVPNGSYWIRVLATDASGNDGGLEFRVQVVGDLKLGQFTTSFVDLVVPLEQLPIVIERRYSSLDLSIGDFGPGWRLALPGDVRDDAEEVSHPVPLVDDLNDQAFTFGTRVYVTLPDGRRVGFTFEVDSTSVPLAVTPRFEPDPGVEATLEAVPRFGSSALFFTPPGYSEFIFPYNPEVYRLTTRDGITYTISEEDGLTRIEDSNGNTIDVTPGGLVSSTGASVQFVRDAEGRIASIIEPDPGTGAPGQLDYFYDGKTGNLVGFQDQEDFLTEYLYEAPGYPNHLTRIEDPLDRPVIQTVYDASGRIIAQCNELGDATTLDGCVEIDSDVAARMQTIVDANGNRTDLFFDDLGNVTIERKYEDATTFYDTVLTYDKNGNEASITYPDGYGWTLTYDERGNRLTQTNTDFETWTYTYNDCNELTQQVDALGNTWTAFYDEDCNLLNWMDPLGNTYSQTFNSQGRRTSYTDPEGNLWQYTYNGQGYPDTITAPWGATMTLVTNGAGEIESITWFDGKSKDFVYDDLHRVIQETWNTVPPTVITYDYDDSGRLLSATNSAGTVTRSYWSNGLIRDDTLQDQWGKLGLTYGELVGLSFQPGYDGVGNVTQILDSLGGTTRYSYDSLNRLQRVEQFATAAASVQPKRIDVGYLGAGLPTGLQRFSDLAGLQPVVSTAFSYGCGSCATSLEGITHVRDSDSSVIHQIDLVRDALENVVEMSDAEGFHQYTFDGVRRLVSALQPGGALVNESYSYDGAGNRIGSHLSATHVIGYQAAMPGNWLLENDQYHYEYDLNGDLELRIDKVTLDQVSFEYDHSRRLVRIAAAASGGTLLWETRWSYDALGRRVAVEENGVVRRYLYDGENPIAVVDVSGNVLERRLYGRGIDEALASERGGSTRWLLTDHLGSVRDVVDDSGTVLNHYVYDSFGSIVDELDPFFVNEIRYTSRSFDVLSGFQYSRRRSYDPAIGRFQQQDGKFPYSYEYGSNNPLFFTDPMGQLSASGYVILGSVIGLALFFCGPTTWVSGALCDFPTGVDLVYDLYLGADAFPQKVIDALQGNL